MWINIGDQSLKERSTAVLSGGPEWVSKRPVDRVLAVGGGTSDVGVPVLSMNHVGEFGMANLRSHWPMICLVIFAIVALWWYNNKV